MRRVLFIPASFILGVWLLLPGRNAFGNPRYEELIEQCVIPGSSAIVRLYEGNAHATVGFWYSVTFQESSSHRERQFFYTYSHPAIYGIECKEDSVEIATGQTKIIPISQITDQLTRRPLGIRAGEEEYATIQPLRLFSMIVGVTMLGTSLLLTRPLVSAYYGR
jgi:hypothetical protein